MKMAELLLLNVYPYTLGADESVTKLEIGRGFDKFGFFSCLKSHCLLSLELPHRGSSNER